MMVWREQHHNASGMKEYMLERWEERTEKKMTTSTIIELGKHPCKKGLRGVVGKTTTKRTSL